MNRRLSCAVGLVALLLSVGAQAADEQSSWISAVPMVCALQNPAYAESRMAQEMRKNSRYEELFNKLKKDRDTPAMQCLVKEGPLPDSACQQLMDEGPSWTDEQMDAYTQKYGADLKRTFEALKTCSAKQ